MKRGIRMALAAAIPLELANFFLLMPPIDAGPTGFLAGKDLSLDLDMVRPGAAVLTAQLLAGR